MYDFKTFAPPIEGHIAISSLQYGCTNM